MWFTLLLEYHLLPLSFLFLLEIPTFPPRLHSAVWWFFSLIMTFNLSEASSKTPKDQVSLFFVSSCEFSPVEWFICSLWLQTLVCYPFAFKCIPSFLDWSVSSQSQEHSMVTQLHSSAPIVFWTGILSPLSFAHSTPSPGHLLVAPTLTSSSPALLQPSLPAGSLKFTEQEPPQ